MLKSEMQHQFWVTKKTVQRKLGSKEDAHILSSDAELDAKIEILKSITDTSADLSKIIDQYQERLCILSQEECVLGRFLREVGKRSKTTCSSITNTGKAVSYSGQQRMCVRVPLLRLQHEVDVFRNQAVQDTQATIQSMEKERTEYRAALCWMKSASMELDPDSVKNLEKFRTAQTQVRISKQNFDSLSLDSVQKIDLLAAARCNMYSHALVSYMSELRQFAEKTANTFDSIVNSILLKPKYDFCVLKELTNEESANITDGETKTIETTDQDQSLFFADDYVDDKEDIVSSDVPAANENSLDMLSLYKNDELLIPLNGEQQTNESNNKDLLKQTATMNCQNEEDTTKLCKQNKNNSTWMDLFAELDPLAHPEEFDSKLNGGRNNCQQT